MQYYIEHFTNCTSLSHRSVIRVIRRVLATAHFHLLFTYKYSSAFWILGGWRIICFKSWVRKGSLQREQIMNSEIKKTGIRDLTKESKGTTVRADQESERSEKYIFWFPISTYGPFKFENQFIRAINVILIVHVHKCGFCSGFSGHCSLLWFEKQA